MIGLDPRLVGLAVGLIVSATPELLPATAARNVVRIIISVVALFLGMRVKGGGGGFLFGLGAGVALAGLIASLP